MTDTATDPYVEDAITLLRDLSPERQREWARMSHAEAEAEPFELTPAMREAIRLGEEDMAAGRVVDAETVYDDLRRIAAGEE